MKISSQLLPLTLWAACVVCPYIYQQKEETRSKTVAFISMQSPLKFPFRLYFIPARHKIFVKKRKIAHDDALLQF